MQDHHRNYAYNSPTVANLREGIYFNFRQPMANFRSCRNYLRTTSHESWFHEIVTLWNKTDLRSAGSDWAARNVPDEHVSKSSTEHPVMPTFSWLAPVPSSDRRPKAFGAGVNYKRRAEFSRDPHIRDVSGIQRWRDPWLHWDRFHGFHSTLRCPHSSDLLLLFYVPQGFTLAQESSALTSALLEAILTTTFRITLSPGRDCLVQLVSHRSATGLNQFIFIMKLGSVSSVTASQSHMQFTLWQSLNMDGLRTWLGRLIVLVPVSFSAAWSDP